ncbi:MAG: hypothetical protein OHK0022_55030 [Roseiflexaceae bacterium]
MQNGRCAKCGAAEVYTDKIPLARGSQRSFLAGIPIFDVYTCVACGYTELALNDEDGRQVVRDEWQQVAEPPAVGTTRLPPPKINGARVLSCGPLGKRVRPTGRHHIQMPDGSTYLPAGVAFAQHPGDPWIVRFYCDEDWNVVTEQVYPDLDKALAAVEEEYVGASALLMKFPF